eukprot:CAMPEP_0176098434 /NCGR_PEP_ID=MMETSP0120_2-20121206/49354_1 /TAXON_ID=160619 /ORGANISM="Kryptoperidinium foliaceum, Strain CCMP 1326" /LENGTH=456 /DNA_ID=CAMNT_0017432441 /DNA_START=46 /DNA_END=1412 /DNA_ORIENTATION=+
MALSLAEDLWLQLLPKLRPYEVSQLSLLTFLVVFFSSFALQTPIFLAAVLLAAVPISRICPGCSSKAAGRRALGCCVVVVVAIVLIWATRYALAARRRPPVLRMPEPEVMEARGEVTSVVMLHPPDCSVFRGRDCSGALAEWAGLQHCTILAETNGTCKAFCVAHNRQCIKAMDDIGTGACALALGGEARQTNAENACLQDWRTQICVCTGGVPDPVATARRESPPRVAPSMSPSAPPGAAGRPSLEPRRAHATPTTTTTTTTTTTSAAPTLQELRRQAPCFFEGAYYHPVNMIGHGRSDAATPSRCQERCARTPGCAHFSWWPDGGCHLQEYAAALRHAGPGDGMPIAGPGDCDDEAMLASIHGDSFSVGMPPSPPPPPPVDSHRAGAERAARPRRRDARHDKVASAAAPAIPAEFAARLTSEQLVGESSPWLLLAILIAFAGLAGSGRLDAPAA